MDFGVIRKCFRVGTAFGWLAPLLLPVLLWWFSTNSALHTLGLLGEERSRSDAISTLTKYAEAVRTFPGEPQILIYDKRNANREARLVVRTLNDETFRNDVLGPFIFPLFMTILFAVWLAAIAIRYRASPHDPWRARLDNILMFGNIAALAWFVGFKALAEHVFK
jgi:hypothetical protein